MNTARNGGYFFKAFLSLYMMISSSKSSSAAATLRALAIPIRVSSLGQTSPRSISLINLLDTFANSASWAWESFFSSLNLLRFSASKLDNSILEVYGLIDCIKRTIVVYFALTIEPNRFNLWA